MSEETNQNGRVATIIIILVVVVAGLIASWYFFIYIPEQEAIEKARLEELAKKEAEKKRREQAKQKKAKYDKLIEDANSAFQEENWLTANALYSEASSLYPNQKYPKDQLALVELKLNEETELEFNSTPGEVQTINTATDRYYVIISSSIDDDLAFDFANRLAEEGNAVKVIEPYNNKFYRVSLADFATVEEAEASSNSYTSYGEGVWVLKY